jgi:uncharacterized protein (TIGR03435 family)
MTHRCSGALALILILLLFRTATAQDHVRLTFDVASIRPSKEAGTTGGIKPLGGGNGYIVQNIPVKLMMSLMYKIPMRQITGGPVWLDSERFDIQAKTDHPHNIDDLHVMFQNLLADRFNLQFHKESREGKIYALTVDKSGLKMTPNTSQQDFSIPVNFGPNGTYIGKRVPMPYLCWFLSQALQSDERPVVDRTGLDGNYDFTLLFAPQLPPGVSRDTPDVLDRPSLFEAVREQLGLRLEPTRGPVDMFIIDHIDGPSDN